MKIKVIKEKYVIDFEKATDLYFCMGYKLVKCEYAQTPIGDYFVAFLTKEDESDKR
jgi:hypothetical protein